jgi:hypothetical protein
MTTSIDTNVSNNKTDTVELYLPSFLNFVLENCPDNVKISFDNFISQHKDYLFWYPNGTLQIISQDIINAFKKTEYHQYAQQKECDIIMNQHNSLKKPIERIIDRFTYTSLPPWSKQHYIIYHCEPFASQLPDGNIFFILRNDIYPERQKFYESPIESVPVHVVFKRNLDKKIREQFINTIACWIASVENNKIFDGNKISTKENSITFYSKVAYFIIDVSQSSQMVVNWLILLLIDFCKYAPITNVFFTQLYYVKEFIDEEIFSTIAENYKSKYPLPVALRMTQQQTSLFTKYKQTTFEDAYQLASQKQTTIIFSLSDIKTAGLPFDNSNCENKKNQKNYKDLLPHDATQHVMFHSDNFPILITPPTTYDHLWITIFFDSKISSQIKRQIIKDISLWIQMGNIGGFGGTFSASYNPEFDAKRNTLHAFVDQGNVNTTLSLSVLVNIIETWDLSGITVYAMLLDNHK